MLQRRLSGRSRGAWVPASTLRTRQGRQLHAIGAPGALAPVDEQQSQPALLLVVLTERVARSDRIRREAQLTRAWGRPAFSLAPSSEGGKRPRPAQSRSVGKRSYHGGPCLANSAPGRRNGRRGAEIPYAFLALGACLVSFRRPSAYLTDARPPSHHRRPVGCLWSGRRSYNDGVSGAVDDGEQLRPFLLRHFEFVERLVEVVDEGLPLVRGDREVPMGVFH
jgi:hypothetical protein